MQNTSNLVVFVAGADFSGTTMLDFILGSAAEACSLGEIYPFVTPTSRHHNVAICSCQKNCGTWSFKTNKTSIHKELFTRRQCQILVDSSKHPLWIKNSVNNLEKQGIESKIVLIWKEPASYAMSCANRGRGSDWAKKWINYHRALEETGLPYYSIKLNSVIGKDLTELEKMCKYVGISFSEEMFDYWKFEHHIVFGSATARNQLFEAGTLEKKLTESNSKKIASERQHIPTPHPANSQEEKHIKDIQHMLATSKEHQFKDKILPIRYWRIAIKKYLEIGMYKTGIDPSIVSRFARKLRANN